MKNNASLEGLKFGEGEGEELLLAKIWILPATQTTGIDISPPLL